MPPQQIIRYVDVDDTPSDGFSTITLYLDQNGTEPTDGSITVPAGGAIVTWTRLPNRNHFWWFNSLVVHPLGDDTSRVDLEWFVEQEQIKLKDQTGRARSFSYTIGLKLEDGKKVYLDPQLVNVG